TAKQIVQCAQDRLASSKAGITWEGHRPEHVLLLIGSNRAEEIVRIDSEELAESLAGDTMRDGKILFPAPHTSGRSQNSIGQRLLRESQANAVPADALPQASWLGSRAMRERIFFLSHEMSSQQSSCGQKLSGDVLEL